MNRRQKMKRMKQELEWYKKQLVPTREFGTERLEERTLVNVSYYDMDYLYGRRLEDICEEVGVTLSHVISENYTEYDEEVVDMGDCPMMKITAKVRVVVPYGGDGI